MLNNNSYNKNSNCNINDNNNYHEIIFWKVFRNKYIRNNILFKIINNKSYYGYIGTTSLRIMITNGKLHMILDKLKSNHHIHIDTWITDWDTKRYKIKDPYYKSITNKINQLLCSSYFYIRRRDMFPEIEGKRYTESQISILERYKLCYPDNKNNFNNYIAHSLLYKLLNSDHNYNNIQLIQYLNQQINNNKEYNNTTKKQKLNNNTNNKREYFIQQLIPAPHFSSIFSSPSTLENEVIEAIYNDQPIPIHINEYYINQFDLKIYNDYDQDLFENQLKVDIWSILLNLNKDTVIYNCNNKQMLELILLKLLYPHHYTIKLESALNERLYNYPLNSLVHAKIYCLNQFNSWKNKDKQVVSSILNFKKYLINNQVNTLDELISVARNSFNKLDYEMIFGHYFYYHIITSNQLDKYSFNSPEFSTLLLNYSIITQQTELFDRYFKLSKGIITNTYENLISIRNSISFNDKLIKDKSTTYFNHIINGTNYEYIFIVRDGYYDYWFQIFKMIIESYNSKLFEWLLESNKQLKDIYHKLFSSPLIFNPLFIQHTRIDINSDQVDYEMLDVLINHSKIIELPNYTYENFAIDNNIKKSNQRKVKIFNHLIKSPSSCNQTTNQLIFIMLVSFEQLESVDDIIEIYNQIDQRLLFNYYSSINDNQLQSSKPDISNYQNKSSILVPLLIQSFINLNFNSINKIISATLNNNIYIPTTFNNSLDIIKYLISNQYLKEFSLYYILDQIISNIQVDKEFIIELIQLSKNNEISNTTTTKITTDKFIKQSFKNMDQIKENEYRMEIESNQVFTLSTLERIKYEYENTKNYEFLKGTPLQPYDHNEIITRAIEIYYSNGYYGAIYHFLNNNEDIYFDNSYSYLNTASISIEWFSKLYPFLFKNMIWSNTNISQLCYHNPEIFELIWNNHLDDCGRISYIKDFLIYNHESDSYQYEQLMEYIFKTKREFIISINLHQDEIDSIEELFLCCYYDNIHLFHQIRLTFNFEINYRMLKVFFWNGCYEIIEYLLENNLITNLEQIIGTANLNNLRIREYSKYYTEGNILVPKSSFILIHTIIKLQKQQQYY